MYERVPKAEEKIEVLERLLSCVAAGPDKGDVNNMDLAKQRSVAFFDSCCPGQLSEESELRNVIGYWTP